MTGVQLVVLFKDSREAVLLARGLHKLGWAPRAVRNAGLMQESLSRRPADVLLIEDRAVGMNPAAWLESLDAAGFAQLPVVVISNLPPASASAAAMGLDKRGARVLAKPFTLAAAHGALLEVTGQGTASRADTEPTTASELLLVKLGEAARSPRPVTVVRESATAAIRFHVRAGRLLATSASPPGIEGIGAILAAAGRLRKGDLQWATEEIGPRGKDADLLDILRKYCGLSDTHAAAAVRIQCLRRLRIALDVEEGDVRSVAAAMPPAGLCLLDEPLGKLVIECLREGDPAAFRAHVIERGRTTYTIGRGVLGALHRLVDGGEEQRFVDALAAGRTVVGALDDAGLSPERGGPLLVYLERVASAPVAGEAADPAQKARALARMRLSQVRALTPPPAAPPAAEDAKAAAGAPEPAGPREDRDELIAQAVRRMASSRYDQAAAALDEVLSADPDDAEALAHLGYCRFHLRTGSRMEAARRARELLERSRELAPESPTPLLHLARISRRLGELDGALLHAAQAVKLSPGDPAAEREVELAQGLLADKGGAAVTQIPEQVSASAATTAEVEGSLIEALRSLTASTPDERTEFAVAVAWWSRGGGVSSTFGGSHVPLEVKTSLMRAVRESDATLREFSRQRLCAVLRSGAKEELRLGAAALGNRLLTELRGQQGSGRGAFEARFALSLGEGPVGALDEAVDKAIGTADALMREGDPWQVVAPRPMFGGFEGLVDVVEVPSRPGVVFVIDDQGAPRAPSPVPPPPRSEAPPPRSSPRPRPEVSVTTPPPAGASSLASSLGAGGSLGAASLGRSVGGASLSMALSAGATLGDTHRIEGFIGAGGMGEVYRAVDLALDRLVAIKVVRKELLANPLSLRRFRREAQALATLNSPNVTQIFSLSLSGDPAYLVMELVDGPSLRDLLQERCTLSVAETVEVALQVVGGLETVYQQGLIHRDINPKNLLLDRSGVVKITDFGLVRAEMVGSSLSGSHAVVGTPLYISPEQAQGGAIDFRTDLYSFGITLYHMLAGRPPYSGSTVAELLTKHILEPMPSLRRACPQAPRALCDLVDELCAKQPDDRPAAHQHVLERLRTIEDGLV